MSKAVSPPLIAVAAAVLILASGVAGARWALGHRAPSGPPDHQQDDVEAVDGARIALAQRFPEAQLAFGRIDVRWNDAAPAVCGRVDIQEEQDAFNGPERFVLHDGDLTVEQADGVEAVDQAWRALCA